jgi:hypothetical protein
MHPIDFASRILELSRNFKFSVTSWGRTEAHNKCVGSVHSDSKHCEWLAVDAVLDDLKDAPAFKAWINKIGLGFLDEGTHIHIQPHLETK